MKEAGRRITADNEFIAQLLTLRQELTAVSL